MADLDHKIDELRAEMREGFKEIRAEFKNVRSEIKDVQDKVEVGFKEIRGKLKNVRTEAHAEVGELRSELNARFIGLERSITPVRVSLTGGMAAVVAALVATNL